MTVINNTAHNRGTTSRFVIREHADVVVPPRFQNQSSSPDGWARSFTIPLQHQAAMTKCSCSDGWKQHGPPRT